MVSGNTIIDKTRLKSKSFGPVDLEISTFNGPFSVDTIEEILNLPSVEKHIKRSAWFKRRPAYLITAISVAKNSFHVTEEFELSYSASLGASGTVPTGAIPLETGASIGKTGTTSRVHEYDTAAGVVVSFRCHVIQAKGQSRIKHKIFTSREAFCTGSGKETLSEQQDELEIISLTGDVVKMDLDEDVEFVEEEACGENWIAFPVNVTE